MNLTMTCVSSHFESPDKYYQALSMPLDTEWMIMTRQSLLRAYSLDRGQGLSWSCNVDGR